jgi:hypothetical protein
LRRKLKSVITNDVGNTTLVQLKINAAVYPAIYGRDVAFEFSTHWEEPRPGDPHALPLSDESDFRLRYFALL